MGLKRVYVAVVFIPLFYLLVKYLPPLAFHLFVIGGILLGLYEFYGMYYKDSKSFEIPFGLIGGILLAVLLSQKAMHIAPESITGLVVAVLLVELFCKKDLKTALTDGAVLLIGVLYVGWLLGHLLLLRNLNGGEYLIFFVFLVTWSCDTGAYYTGRLLGSRALAPRVSPNKTIEGAVGGIVWGLASSLLARWWFLPALSIQDAVGLGLLLGVFGQLGDLTESMLKRSAGVKDSSRLVPGHGGILDKVDSLIFAAPAFYYYTVWIKQ